MEASDSRICQTLGVPRQSRGFTHYYHDALAYGFASGVSQVYLPFLIYLNLLNLYPKWDARDTESAKPSSGYGSVGGDFCHGHHPP